MAAPAEASKAAPLAISQGFDWGSVTTNLERTLAYVKDPRAYLEDKRGAEWVQEHEQELCLPTAETLDRDAYGTGKTKAQFEQHLARLFGKQHALFMITGVQAQTVACRLHCDNVGRTLCAWHLQSHLEADEHLAYKHVFGLDHTPLGQDPFKLSTVEDVRRLTQRSVNDRPAVILVELPNRRLGCATWSFEELGEMSKLCKDAGIKFHCDGARIWEIEPYYAEQGKSFREIAGLFDSIYVSLYKALGGAAGAMLLSNDEKFIANAKIWARRLGGNPVTLFYEVLDCQRGFNESFGTLAHRRRKMASVVEAIKNVTSKYTQPASSNPILSFNPPKPTCCAIHTHLDGYTREQLDSARDRVQETLNIRVYGRVNAVATAEELQEAKHQALGYLKDKDEADAAAGRAVDRKRYSFEWQIGKTNEDIPDADFARGWQAFLEELTRGHANSAA